MEYSNLIAYLNTCNEEERNNFYRGIVAWYDDEVITEAQILNLEKTAKKFKDVVL